MLPNAKRVLVIVSERIGDVIFCTPSLALLRAAKPETTIDVLVMSPASAQVLINNPNFDNLHISLTKSQCEDIAHLYDCILVLHNNPRAREYVEWFNKPAMLFDDKEDGPKLRALAFASFTRDCLEQPHIEIPGNYQLFPAPQQYVAAENLLKERGATFTGDEILVGCHLGCHHIAKRGAKFWKRDKAMRDSKSWPYENFQQLAKEVYAENKNIKFVLTGTKNELKLAMKYMKKLPNTINVIGETSVLELNAMMTFFKAFITADTGPSHVACASDVPLIVMFGPTPHESFGPYPPSEHRVVIAKDTIEEISVAHVKDTLFSLLK